MGKEIVKKETTVSTFVSTDIVLQKLLDKDVDLDKLEKLLELKGKYEERENEKLFHEKFADMQAELPIIKKTKAVEGKYKYAPLESIVKQIKPFLKKYGFSYRWSEGMPEKENTKRVICHIMAYGYEQTSYVDIPLFESPTNSYGKKVINDVQVSGAMSSYGKRYSLIGALGIMADDDVDMEIKKNDVQNVDKAFRKKTKEMIEKSLKKLGYSKPKFEQFVRGMFGDKKWSEINDADKRMVASALEDKINDIEKELKENEKRPK